MTTLSDIGRQARAALQEEKRNERMEETEDFLFRWCYVCLLIFGVMASLSILNLSIPGCLASLVWLGMAGVFAYARKKLPWVQ